MTNLVNSLRSMPSEIYGYFFVCDDVFETDNIITPAQVSIATGKGWIVKKLMKDDIYGSNYAGFGDVNGDDNIDQYDLDTIVNIIMGLEDLEKVLEAALEATVVASHMDNVGHSTLWRSDIREFAAKHGVEERLLIPEDGETCEF